jgi:Tfp pilus assembly protein PilV
MVRRGFTLVEVVVSTTLLAVAVLGLVASAALAQRALLAAELQEQAVRHAAALLDSLSFNTRIASADSAQRGPISLRWEAAGGLAAPVRVAVQYRLPAGPVTLTFFTHRVPPLPVRRP